MFCPNCSQAFDSRGIHSCPICGFRLGYTATASTDTADAVTSGSEAPAALSRTERMDAGVGRGTKIIVLAVILFPMYKVLSHFYPPNTHLPGGKGNLFDLVGQSFLLALLGFGILRVIWAFVYERRKDRSAA